MTARFAAIGALVAAAFLFNLSAYPLLDPDEGRNAEVAREMAATGDYLHPRLDGLPYVDKPVVFYAATAVFIRILGATELAVRLPPFLFTLATLAVVGWWGRRLFGPPAGWIAAIVAGASPLTLAFARTVIMDSALTLWVTVAMVGFHEATETGRRVDGWTGGEHRGSSPVYPPTRLPVGVWWSAVGWISLALGVLTKGPIALALPLMVVVPYAAWRRRLRAVFDPVGLLLFLALVLPWARTMANQAPGYLRYVLGTETFLRLTTPALERTGPWWYFVPVLVLGGFPWTVGLLGAGKHVVRRMSGWADGRMDRGRTVFLALWIVIPLMFFSLSQSKRPQYVLPLVPPVALLVAATWQDRASAHPLIRSSALALGLLGACILLGHSFVAGAIRHLPTSVALEIPATARWLGTVALASGITAWFAASRPAAALLALALPTLAVPVVGGPLLRAVGRDRSAAELARSILATVPLRTEIVGVGAYPPSLPFYLGGTVLVATRDGAELTSNYLRWSVDLWRRVPGTPLRPADWWRDALQECDRPRAFVIRADDAAARALLAGTLPAIAETRKYAAYGPCGRTDLAQGARRVRADERPAPRVVEGMSGWADGTAIGHPSAGPPVRLTARGGE